jgi:hypothetical protein
MTHSWQDDGDLTLSATYIRTTGLTLAVIYGCNDKQKSNIMRRLQNAGDSVHHPLLIVGIFAELEREHLLSRVEELIDRFLQKTEALSNDTRLYKQILNSQGEKPGDLLQLYNDSRNLIQVLQAAKAQLSKIIDHIQELQSIGGQKNHFDEKSDNRNSSAEGKRRRLIKHTGIRIRERLLEISEEYDRKIGDCRMVLEDWTVTTQMVSVMLCYLGRYIANSLGHGPYRTATNGDKYLNCNGDKTGQQTNEIHSYLDNGLFAFDFCGGKSLLLNFLLRTN